MTPTSRERIVGGYGIYETENWLTCLSETIALAGWRDGAVALATVVRKMESLEHYEHPDATQRADREAKKKEWETHLYDQIKELRRWSARLRAGFPPWTADWVDSQLQ